MANVLISEDTMTDIANAIRSKKNVETTYLPSEMPSAIESISGGGITPTGTKEISITTNGTTTENVTDFASVQVNVNVPTGGGGSPLTKLTEITVSENVRSVQISPTSDWMNYDFLLIKYDLTLSANDWLYFSNTDLSGGGYTPSIASLKCCSSMLKQSNSLKGWIPYSNNGFFTMSSSKPIYIYTYTVSQTINAGSSITVYGGNNADL